MKEKVVDNKRIDLKNMTDMRYILETLKNVDTRLGVLQQEKKRLQQEIGAVLLNKKHLNSILAKLKRKDGKVVKNEVVKKKKN